MTTLFLKLYAHYQQNLPFVIYCKPNSETTIGFFQNNDHLYLSENYSESGFIFNSFNNDLKVILPIEFCEVLSEKNALTSIKNEIENSDLKFQENDKLNFEHLVQKAIETIKKGICSKIVVSREEKVPLEFFSIENSFKKLLKNYPSAFNYCFYHPKIGLWMGATPEQLLKVQEKNIKTVALAGTKTLDKKYLEWGNKEKYEQQLVTNFILENIKKYVTEEIISSPYTYQAGNLLHIKTDIEATLQNKKDLKEVIEILHPTPAVCGFPKNLAKDFIFENEGYNRDFYAGFLGELNFNLDLSSAENTDLFVNLRCMKVESNRATIFVGCGITSESKPEHEFLETVQKSGTIKKVL